MDWAGKIALCLYVAVALNLALQKGAVNRAKTTDIMARVQAQQTISFLGSLAAWTLILAVLFTFVWIVRL